MTDACEQTSGLEINNTVPMENSIDHTLIERGGRYGKFEGHAAITQDLKFIMKDFQGGDAWNRLNESQRESLEMIVHKIGRILNGDPNYDDSWVDIAGYATLIVKQLRGEHP
jgi:hypothetical protein